MSETDQAGRYLYCVVRSPQEEEYSTQGLGEEPAYIVTAANGDDAPEDVDDSDTPRLGAIVQPRLVPYDTDDEELATRWLLDHQRVVDDANETFGTPLPFRFDTILEGGDDAVRAWLRAESDTLTDHLDALAGQSEYRIEVTYEERPPEELADLDEELADLKRRQEAASEGKAFLLEKEYEQRLAAVRHERIERSREALREDLAALTTEVRTLDSSAVGDRQADIRLAVLAPEEAEDTIGEILDKVAAESGTEVRFTGPWPPYTFTPTFHDGTEA